jgi:hypothetical protein
VFAAVVVVVPAAGLPAAAAMVEAGPVAVAALPAAGCVEAPPVVVALGAGAQPRLRPNENEIQTPIKLRIVGSW